MIKIAVYGKGGIGKSTTISNIAAALAEKGLTVMQIGCDPKADSTIQLRHGKTMRTVLDLYNDKKQNLHLEGMTTVGYQGVICVEAGGPTPGLGCAGRGIITALEKLKETGAYDIYKPDIVLYDVLGDVVCGGFSMPMRKGYADKVFIITSGENMAIHAGANIAMGKFSDYGGLEIFCKFLDFFFFSFYITAVQDDSSEGGIATVFEVLYCHCDVGSGVDRHVFTGSDDEKVQELAEDFQTTIIGKLTHSNLVTDAEEQGKTLMECYPDSKMAEEYRTLAEQILTLCRKDALC